MGRGLENAEGRASLSAEAISKTKPRLLEQSGVFCFLTLSKARENMEKYKRILLRLTMKNGLELKAPVTDDISRAVAFAIKWVAVGIAVSPMLYGLAKLIVALKS